MVSVINTVDTSHEDMIHDAQMDYYGTRLATCSSDRSVKILMCEMEGRSSSQTSEDMRASVAGGLGSPHVWQYPGFLFL